MENIPKIESNKPQLLAEEAEKKPQELPENGFDASRRNFLKVAAVGVASLLVNPGEVAVANTNTETTITPGLAVEKIKQGKERGIIGRSKMLEALHRSVSNGFEDMIEKEIKNPSKKLSISDFKGHIGRDRGEYVLMYSIDLTPVEKEEHAHRVFSIRGKVCGEDDAISKVHHLYNKEIPPWQERMRKEYPDAHFTTEVKEDGISNAYHKTCIMKGVMKK